MAISLLSVFVKHERRVRLLFSNSVAGGAFTSTSFYSVEELDGAAANPGVAKAIIVASSPQTVELQLDTDLVQGARYRFSAVGVPAIDSSVTPSPSDAYATVGREQSAAAIGAKAATTALERTLFGVGVARDGDWLETPDGDLDIVGGIRAATLDLQRAVIADGLPWAPSYGFRARQEVDGAPASLLALRGRAIALMRSDDRIVAADAAVDLADPSAPTLELRPTWIGARGTPQAPVRVPFTSSR